MKERRIDTHDELGIPLADFRSLTTRIVLVIRIGSGEGVVLVVLAVLKDLDEDRGRHVREGNLHVLVGPEIWWVRVSNAAAMDARVSMGWMRSWI
jgi:hypothetical protein